MHHKQIMKNLLNIATVLTLCAVVSLMMISPKEGFDNSKKKHLVLFYWKTCGHCKDFMPIWDEFTGGTESKTIGFQKIEKDGNKKLIDKLGITGYPTLMLLDDKMEQIETYNGVRSVKALQQYVKKHEEPEVAAM